MWEQLRKDVLKVESVRLSVPPNSFTIHDFIREMKVSRTTAKKMLKVLREAGKVRNFGHIGKDFYYTRD